MISWHSFKDEKPKSRIVFFRVTKTAQMRPFVPRWLLIICRLHTWQGASIWVRGSQPKAIQNWFVQNLFIPLPITWTSPMTVNWRNTWSEYWNNTTNPDLYTKISICAKAKERERLVDVETQKRQRPINKFVARRGKTTRISVQLFPTTASSRLVSYLLYNIWKRTCADISTRYEYKRSILGHFQRIMPNRSFWK